MERKGEKNKNQLPKKHDILHLYKSLKLDEKILTPYDLSVQISEFKRVSIYTDERPCYATSNTEANN